MPVGPSILWPVKPKKSHEDERAGRPGGGDDAVEGRDGAEHVAHRGDPDELHAVDETVEVGEVEGVVVGHGEVAQLDAPLLLELEPRHDVRVVLHLGEEHGVALAQVRPPPRVGDEVERLGDVLREDDLFGVRGAEEPGGLGPGLLEGVGGVGGDLVDAPVHVGVGGLVVPVHGLDHLTGLLGGGGRVEVDEAVPVHLAVEDGEVGADLGDVEGGGVGHRNAS
jgi:hypothetical protein